MNSYSCAVIITITVDNASITLKSFLMVFCSQSSLPPCPTQASINLLAASLVFVLDMAGRGVGHASLNPVAPTGKASLNIFTIGLMKSGKLWRNVIEQRVCTKVVN